MKELATNHTTAVRTPHFVVSPFRYPGGKFYALKYILPFINIIEHDEYREPFVGGGNVFFAKKKAKYNWLNDLEDNLITIYRTMADHKLRSELISLVCSEIATKKRHSEITRMITNSDLETAYKYYYLNRTSYSGIINKPAWGYADGKSSPPPNWRKFIEGAGNKLQHVHITNLDFEEVISAKTKYKSVLMYLDPPYYHADQKRAYIRPFNLNDHLRLAKILKGTKYHFCLSYDDCAEIKKLYKWAIIHNRNWFYNTANSSGPRKVGNELIITNYEISFLDQGQLF